MSRDEEACRHGASGARQFHEEVRVVELARVAPGVLEQVGASGGAGLDRDQVSLAGVAEHDGQARSDDRDVVAGVCTADDVATEAAGRDPGLEEAVVREG